MVPGSLGRTGRSFGRRRQQAPEVYSSRSSRDLAADPQVDGIIKSIVASNQSNTPTFLVVVENVEGSADRFYLSYDLGDSLEQDMTRIDSVSSVASVIPTGTDNPSTTFAVIGKRTADQVPTYRLIEG